MIQIAIVDDEKDQIDQIRNITEDFFQMKEKEYQIHEFTNGEKFLSCTISMDLIFLDIQMDGIDGIETAQKLRVENKKATLFYVTNYSEEMARSFSVHPFAFIEKPINKEKIFRHLQDFLAYTDIPVQKKMITLKGVRGSVTICLQDIIYFEYIGNRKIKMVTCENENILYGSMKQIFHILMPYNFIQTHESFIVNEEQIKAVHAFYITMNDHSEVPIAQKKQKEIVEKISHYLHHQFEEDKVCN